jgi:hypothetical protein
MARMRFIDQVFDSRLVLAAAAAGAVLAGALGVWYFQHRHAPRPAAPAPAADPWAAPIGPGMLAAAPSAPSVDSPAAQVDRGTHIALDAEGHLAPDRKLRVLMDSYLAQASGQQRRAAAQALRAYLKGVLQGPAAREADRLAIDYLGYLEAEQQMRARERFSLPGPAGLSGPDTQHLLDWQSARAQLRERWLGGAVAKAWFDADDAGCAAALHDWQLQREPLEEVQDVAELQERRLHGAMLEEQRSANALDCAARIIDGR